MIKRSGSNTALMLKAIIHHVTLQSVCKGRRCSIRALYTTSQMFIYSLSNTYSKSQNV